MAADDLVQLCVERFREPAARDPETTRHLMHMLHRIREVAEDREAFAVLSEIGRQVAMVLALADANRMLPRDRKRLGREAEAVVDGERRGAGDNPAPPRTEPGG